jgi:hypothetical protein
MAGHPTPQQHAGTGAGEDLGGVEIAIELPFSLAARRGCTDTRDDTGASVRTILSESLDEPFAPAERSENAVNERTGLRAVLIAVVAGAMRMSICQGGAEKQGQIQDQFTTSPAEGVVDAAVGREAGPAKERISQERIVRLCSSQAGCRYGEECVETHNHIKKCFWPCKSDDDCPLEWFCNCVEPGCHYYAGPDALVHGGSTSFARNHCAPHF